MMTAPLTARREIFVTDGWCTIFASADTVMLVEEESSVDGQSSTTGKKARRLILRNPHRIGIFILEIGGGDVVMSYL